MCAVSFSGPLRAHEQDGSRPLRCRCAFDSFSTPGSFPSKQKGIKNASQWVSMLHFANYYRLSNRRRLLNKRSFNFHIMILIHFYINLDITVLFSFQQFQKKSDLWIKFMYSEKTTKFYDISKFIWNCLVTPKKFGDLARFF